MKTKRIFLQNHKPINFIFRQTEDTFAVEEIAKEIFSNSGNFMILKIRKINLSTWDLLDAISDTLEIPLNHIGYAGLKDKSATTIQYISVPLKKGKEYKLLNNKNIKVLQTFRHHSKLKIGDLSGNNFKIILEDINPNDLTIIYQTLSQIQKNGLPNYFGYQRFGKDTTFEHCKAVVYGEKIEKNNKLKHLLVSAYQSYFFNAWLAHRVNISKESNSNKLIALDGDIFTDYEKKNITGLMIGRKVKRSTSKAREVEEQFDDMFIHEKGSRRNAWILPTNIKNKFNKENNTLQLEFTLPKSSYATVFIENIANTNLK